MNQAELTQAVTNHGVSLWLDDLSRERIESGNLQDLITTRNIVGVTTNPAIFQAAISGASAYDEAINDCAQRGVSAEGTITELTTADVRSACDMFASVYERSGGQDGRVSIEVDPRFAHDEEATVRQALELAKLVDRPNVMIKIPATDEGLGAITRVIAEGISVNVTLIFSVERYEEVIEAYLAGLEQAVEAGKDLSTIHSVASFFISRVDSEIDKRLDSGGRAELKGKAGIANAIAAYGSFLESLETERFNQLKAAGAQPQRPLWASTGVKNADYPDTMYVDQLLAEQVVNTVPEKTLEAVADHAVISGTIEGEATISQALATLDQIADADVDLADVFAQLESEGVDKFIVAFEELITTVNESLRNAQ